MAHLSRDKGLLTAFAEGKDIHRATAAEVFGLPLETVTSEQRRSAKAINFGRTPVSANAAIFLLFILISSLMS